MLDIFNTIKFMKSPYTLLYESYIVFKFTFLQFKFILSVIYFDSQNNKCV